MTNETILDRAARDKSAQDELEIDCDKPGGSEGHLQRGWLQATLYGDLVGRVSFSQDGDWLVTTTDIEVTKAYRFRKDVHARGEYQPRYSMYLMQALFDHLAGYEVREGGGQNSEAGIALLKRVREDYKFPYHQSGCFRSESCICGFGVTRAQIG